MDHATLAGIKTSNGFSNASWPVGKEVLDFFISRVEDCRAAGIHDIILDPGMGFAKNHRHNLELLRNLSVFRMLGYPILLGVSRKSTIYKLLGITPEEALNGTTVLHTLGLANGADILRVHDVREARQAITLVEAYKVEAYNENAHLTVGA